MTSTVGPTVKDTPDLDRVRRHTDVPAPGPRTVGVESGAATADQRHLIGIAGAPLGDDHTRVNDRPARVRRAGCTGPTPTRPRPLWTLCGSCRKRRYADAGDAVVAALHSSARYGMPFGFYACPHDRGGWHVTSKVRPRRWPGTHDVRRERRIAAVLTGRAATNSSRSSSDGRSS